MADWYPDKVSIDEAKRRIDASMEAVDLQNLNWKKLLKEVSKGIQLIAVNDAPKHLIRDWIWIASQFRMGIISKQEKQNEINSFLYAVLVEFTKVIEGREGDDYVKNLRWLGEFSTKKLKETGAKYKDFLTESELNQVDQLWQYKIEEGEDYEFSTLEAAEGYIERLSQIESEDYLIFLSEKIKFLIDYTRERKDGFVWSLSALKYLLQTDDIVPDELGVLGLVDDVYVIEQSYDLVKGESIWQRVREELIEKYPQLVEVLYEDKGYSFRLPLHYQIIIGIIVHNILTKRNKFISLTQSLFGPELLLIAFTLLIYRSSDEKVIEGFSKGDLITFPSDKGLVNAIYLMEMKEYAGLHKLKFLDGNASVNERELEVASRAEETNFKLSKQKKFFDWKSSYVPRESWVLTSNKKIDRLILFSKKRSLEKWEQKIRPYGKEISKYINVYQLTESLEEKEVFSGSLNNADLFFSYNIDVIIKAISNLDSIGTGNALKLVLVDSDVGVGSESLILDAAEKYDARVVFLSLAHDYERFYFLSRWGVVNHIFPSNEYGVDKFRFDESREGVSGLKSFLYLQSNQRDRKDEVIVVKDENLENFHNILVSLGAEISDEGMLTYLRFAGFRVLQDLRLNCTRLTPEEVALSIAPKLNSLKRVSQRYLNSYPILKELVHVVDALLTAEYTCQAKYIEAQRFAEKGTMFLVRSEAYIPDFNKNSFLTFEDALERAPLEKLVVIGWLGRDLMRKVSSNQIAKHLVYFFYPFEKEWEKKSFENYQQHKKNMAKVMRETMESVLQGFNINQSFPGIDGVNVEERRGSFQNIKIDIEDESAYLDPIILAEKKRYSNLNDAQTNARLVVFDDFYTYFPPNREVFSVRVFFESGHYKFDSTLVKVEDLQPGNTLALMSGSDGDYIDLIANNFLQDPTKTRKYVNLWKKALRELYSIKGSLSAVKQALQKEGLSRHEMTIKSWIDPQCDVIAPLNYREDLVSIAKATKNWELNEEFELVLKSIKDVYEARLKVSTEIKQNIESAKLVDSTNLLELSIGGQQVSFGLHSINHLGDIFKVPLSQIDNRMSLISLFEQEG